MDSYDIMLYVSYALAAIGTLLAVVMPLIKSLDNPKGLMKTGLAIVGLAVLFFIAYSVSGDEVLPKFEGEPFNLTPSMSKAIGGMLVTTYVLSLVAIVSIVITELSKAVK